MDPVIVVGAGPVGLTLSLALAAQGVPSVVLDEGSGPQEPRPARTVVLREDTADLVGSAAGSWTGSGCAGPAGVRCAGSSSSGTSR